MLMVCVLPASDTLRESGVEEERQQNWCGELLLSAILDYSAGLGLADCGIKILDFRMMVSPNGMLVTSARRSNLVWVVVYPWTLKTC